MATAADRVSGKSLVNRQASGNGWQIYNCDCVEGLRGLPDSIAGFTLHSPPFSSLYVYSDSPRDLGNCKDYEEFSIHYQFVIKELLRITEPGRLCSVHCMNLPTTKTHHGYIGIQDFRGDIIRDFIGDEAADFHRAMTRVECRIIEANASGNSKRAAKLTDLLESMREELAAHPGSNGFIYHSEVCIWKDPVTAMQRTKAIGLLHKQLVKDSCMSRMGLPDYVCTFRKPGVNAKPVQGELDHWIGDDSFKSEGRLSIDIWQKFASPIWSDIQANRTLQYRAAKGDSDERHICPLQLDVIERCMELWTNPGDVVVDPFNGIASTGYCAVATGRKYIGFELKPTYFDASISNLRAAEELTKVGVLF